MAALIAGIPTAGGTVPADMLPVALARLHEVLPFAQFLDAARAGAYAVGDLGHPLAVLTAWVLAAAVLVVTAHARTGRAGPTAGTAAD